MATVPPLMEDRFLTILPAKATLVKFLASCSTGVVNLEVTSLLCFASVECCALGSSPVLGIFGFLLFLLCFLHLIHCRQEERWMWTHAET